MGEVFERAYAKVNLFLDVLSRRIDGFHNIKTVMHSVSLCDDVIVRATLRKSDIKISLSVENAGELSCDESNLAYRAAAVFFDAAGIKGEVDILLRKRIPVSAGLAGGSSDAAAVLRAMNRLYGEPLSRSELLKLAAILGSDVPFCLVGGTALCTSRGEQMTLIELGKTFNFVIVASSERVSTPYAYRQLDEMYSSFDGTAPTGGEIIYESFAENIASGEVKTEYCFNVFESVVLPSCPNAARAKQRLSELGAQKALMSGSGASVFAVFDGADTARKAAEQLSSEGFTAFTAHSI